MWGMYLGLDMTLRENITQFIVQSDLKILVDLIMTVASLIGLFLATLVRHIHKFLSLSWTIQVNHT
jgi:hypothetical protein